MKKNKKIYVLIVIISLSLAGLIALQVYYLKNVYDQKEQAFKRNVLDALNKTSHKIETSEVISGIFNYVAEPGRIDSLNKNLDTSLLKKNLSVIMIKSLFKDSGHEERFDTIITDQKKRTKFQVKLDVDKNKDSIIMFDKHFVSDTTFNYSYKIETTDSSLRKTKKGIFVSNVVDRLVQFEIIPVEKRISPKTLDSVLNIFLKELNITIPYRFAVFSGIIDSMKYAMGNDSTISLVKSDLKTNLFPSDMLPVKNVLALKFPEQNSFIYKQILSVIALSFIFTSIIIFSFIYSLRTIIKQKKFSALIVDFINNMTHEFKTPLSTVALASEAIEKPEVFSDKVKLFRYNKIIKEENQRMKQQVDKILQMAVLEEGDYELNLVETDIHELIKNVSCNTALQVESRGGSIEYYFDAEEHRIKGDILHLTNIFNNILDNANKYSLDNPEIRISTDNINDMLRIRISDNGIGIDEDDLEKVFDKYYRVPTGNKHDVKGFGLGLSYVKLLVEAHKGKIEIISKPGNGSTVNIFFPIYRENKE